MPPPKRFFVHLEFRVHELHWAGELGLSDAHHRGGAPVSGKLLKVCYRYNVLILLFIPF